MIAIVHAACAGLVLTGLFAAPVHAQQSAAYPTQTMRIVAGVAPGGLIDIYPRFLSPLLQNRFGQPVIVENRPGSGGLIAARSVAEAKPDGYTLLAASSGTLPAALMHDPSPYTIASFVPVALMLEGGSFVGIRAGIPAATFQELVAYAKANPGTLRYGTSGVGSPTHLSFQYLADAVGIKLTHVPYRGNTQAVQALLQSEIDMTVVNAVGFEKQIQSGEIRVLAQTSRQKAAVFSNVPSLADLVPGYDAPFWLGLFAPAGTPPKIVAQLNSAVNAGIVMDAFRLPAEKSGLYPVQMTPEKFAQYVKEDTDRWATVIKANNIKAE
jgi:tripartite-type tricarboxylate transporter receptor subunit TctC